MHIHNTETDGVFSIEELKKFILNSVEWHTQHGKCCVAPEVEVSVEWGHVEGVDI